MAIALGSRVKNSRYAAAMTDPEGIDPAFLHAISGFAGTSEELEFERRGSGDSTYTLHGKVVSVDRKNGTVQIQRTRTNAGEVHEMGLCFFLSAAPRSGGKVENRIAVKRNEMFREKQRARKAAVASASFNPSYKPGEKSRRSRFVGLRQGVLDEFPSDRYVYEGLEGGHRKVAIIASSFAAADKFMSMQDIFMPLDDMVWHAIDSRVLWPAGVAFDRQVNPSAWSLNWFKLFDVLAGLPKEVLMPYLDLIHSGRVNFGVAVAGRIRDTTVLAERGLLEVESAPKSLAEILKRIPVVGLRHLLKETSSNSKVQTRGALAKELSRLATSKLEASAIRLMRSPLMRVKAPTGLVVEELDRAVRELRDSIFLMRQWILETRELYREDELRQLVDVA
jgi:hypothetical protein